MLPAEPLRWLDTARDVLCRHPLPWVGQEVRLLAQMLAESAGDLNARSSAGAAGLMQLMPPTAEEILRDRFPGEEWSPYDPEQSLRLGAYYMGSVLAPKFDERAASPLEHWRLCLVAYNAGMGRVNRAMIDARPMSYESWVESGRLQGRWRTVQGIQSRLMKTAGREPFQYLARIEQYFASLAFQLGENHG